jgi:hypothetical protein
MLTIPRDGCWVPVLLHASEILQILSLDSVHASNIDRILDGHGGPIPDPITHVRYFVTRQS